jgi:hypothetical protein
VGNQPGILFTLAVRMTLRIQSNIRELLSTFEQILRRSACMKASRQAQRGSARYHCAVASVSMCPSVHPPRWCAALQATCRTMHNILCDPAEASIWEEA